MKALAISAAYLLLAYNHSFSGEYTITKDIPYLGADRAEKMDAYIPDIASPTPAVLLIHGGGWSGGDKADAREKNIGNTLALNGYAVFSINYQLNSAGKIAWPQNFYDCKSGLRYIRKNARQFNIDPTRIATMGGSAGGHLAMLVGTTSDNAELNKAGLYADETNKVSCILNFYGIFDVTTNMAAKFKGKTSAESEANAILASPKNHITKDSPPFFVTHGTSDNTVPVSFSRDLVKLLKEKTVKHTYVEIKGAPHTYHLQPKQKDIRSDVLKFLGKNL